MKQFYLVFVALFLVGCNGDGIKDKDPDERMVREAMCVAASERFLLYEEAKRHKSHGIEAGEDRFIRTGKNNDFAEQISKARSMMANYSKDFNANFLKKRCDREITVGEFDGS